MLRVEISREDLKAIKRERFYHPQPHVMIRMHVLALHAEGECATRITKLLGMNRKTTQACLHAYKKDGLAGVYRYEKYKPKSELDGFDTLLEDKLAKNPPPTAAEADAKIAELTGIKRSPTQIRAFLKKGNPMFENGQHAVQSRSDRAKEISRKHDGACN